MYTLYNNLWTILQIILCSLKSHPSRWTLFVSYRMPDVQQLTSGYQQHLIRSRDNSADILFRGILANQTTSELIQFQVIIPEQRRVIHFSKKENLVYDYLLRKFSAFTRFKTVLAHCLRYFQNSKLNSDKVTRSLILIAKDGSQNFKRHSNQSVKKRNFARSHCYLSAHSFILQTS